MLVQNQIDGGHHKIVSEQLKAARCADLIIAYVQASGVSALREEIAALGKNIRLICSFDMDITDPDAVGELLNLGVAVRVYQARRGTFHPKLWLFGENADKWNCLIGSANLTGGAMFHNIEAGALLSGADNRTTIGQAHAFFNRLWNSEECRAINKNEIAAWSEKRIQRKKLNARIAQKKEISTDDDKRKLLSEYVNNWIDIGVGETTSGAGKVTGRLWRGWYIIPDHGLIEDDLMDRLHQICWLIHDAGGRLGIATDDATREPFAGLLRITAANLKREKRKMNPRSLFVRQEKNYLIKLDLARHPLTENSKPIKSILSLTPSGSQFALASSVAEQKRIYTEAMENYFYNGLPLLEFTRTVLARVQRLSFNEFSLLVSHAYSLADLEIIVELVNIFRQLSKEVRAQFLGEVNAYFRTKLEHTGSGVQMNYDKNANHTMSALGWCNGLKYDAQKKELRLAPDGGAEGI